MATPYTRLTKTALKALEATRLDALRPYQIRQVQEFLDRVNWGNAEVTPGSSGALGKGSDSDVGAQPTIAQVIVLVGASGGAP